MKTLNTVFTANSVNQIFKPPYRELYSSKTYRNLNLYPSISHIMIVLPWLCSLLTSRHRSVWQGNRTCILAKRTRPKTGQTILCPRGRWRGLPEACPGTWSEVNSDIVIKTHSYQVSQHFPSLRYKFSYINRRTEYNLWLNLKLLKYTSFHIISSVVKLHHFGIKN